MKTNYTTKKLPPFGKIAVRNPSPIHQSIIFTGSDAWSHVGGNNFYPTSNKLVLPFGENPGDYKWPVGNTDIMIFSKGHPEDKEQLLRLSKSLLQYGANFVLWVFPNYPITKFVRKVAV